MTKKITTLSMLIAFTLICSIIEDRIPLPISLPGIKLGLANIFIFSAIILFSIKEALFIVLIRTIMNAIFGSTPIVLLYSLPAGLLSAILMFLLYKYLFSQLSIISISVCGSIVHILTQLTIYTLVSNNDPKIFLLSPVLFLSSIATGLFVGTCTKHLSDRLKKIIYG